MWQAQPHGSNLCGQTCVSMLTGFPIGLVCKVMGKRGKTGTRDIVNALRFFGFQVPDRTFRVSYKYTRPNTQGVTFPKCCIIRLTEPTPTHHIVGQKTRRALSHWVLLFDGVVYDPDAHDGQECRWPATSLLALLDFVESNWQQAWQRRLVPKRPRGRPLGSGATGGRPSKPSRALPRSPIPQSRRWQVTATGSIQRGGANYYPKPPIFWEQT